MYANLEKVNFVSHRIFFILSSIGTQVTRPSLEKNVCLALPTQGFTWWVGRWAFFLIKYKFTICTWTEMVKKISDILDLEKNE